MLLVGTDKGLFILDPEGERRSWSMRGPYVKGWKVYSAGGWLEEGKLRLTCGLASAIYGPHLQRSDDGGETWVPLEGTPVFPQDSPRRLKEIWSLHRAPEPGHLFAGVAEAALFESHDSGKSWELNQGLDTHPTREQWQPGAGGLCLHTIIQNPARPEQLFVGISAVGVLRSDDAGKSWQVKNQGVDVVIPDEEGKYSEIDRCVHKLVQDPREPDRLYQQNHIGVFRSTNAGDSWHRIEKGLPSRFGFPMAMHPRDSETLYVIPQESDQYRMFPEGRLRVYRTQDRGDSWAPLGEMPDHNYAGVLRDALAVDAGEAAGIYFGTSSGQLFGSVDEGASWQQLPGQYPRILNVKVVGDSLVGG